jgi:uncharacterized delta-60 repeat protein/uncharacterized repeat protein (TIGR01451 family)
MKYLFRTFFGLCLLLLFSLNDVKAQNAADPDNNFNIGTGGTGPVNIVAVQADGKIIIVGWFISFNGASTKYLARLNADGSVDNTFTLGTALNYPPSSIAIQPDGKIIIGGENLISFNGVPINGLARLNQDGTLDNSFNIGTGVDNSVSSIAIQPDGKIIIAGSFTSFNGVSINRLARLNEDGSLDNSFNIGTGVSANVNSIAIQANGKIIIVGWFDIFNGITKNHVARINADGSLDNTFNIGTGADTTVTSIAIQADGKIVLGGWFSSFNGVSKNNLTRLNSDGTLDNTFNIGTGTDSEVFSIAIQKDGKIILGGAFGSFNGVSLNYLARLNIDGSLDNSFNIGTGTNGSISSIAIQKDGKIILGGGFSSYQSIPHYHIIRLAGDPVYYNNIRGNIYSDDNNDCISQLSENRLPSVVVKAMPGLFYGSSDWGGKYEIKVDTGTFNYILTQEYNSINSKLLINQCASSHTISLKGAAKDTSSFDFADSVKQCALLNINVQKSRMRRCFRSNTYVNYCNYGSTSASGAQVRVVYPSYIKPISSVPMWSSKQDSVLIYDIATIPDNFCGSITIIDSVVCGDESIRGLTQCIKASISPASNCVPENSAWDRSSMMVTGSCVNGNAVFVMNNQGSGSMADSLEYRVYVNDTLIFSGNYKLISGEILTVSYPAGGQTIRLEADQHPLHPGKSRPRATVENCGVAASEVRNLVITAPQDDLDEEVAITCSTIRDSYDPNDKLAMPIGIGASNMVAPGTELEYTIRFQNTGNDTAYTVRVIDTLDVNLDAASFTQGASSHPYTLSISGKGQAVLAFNFYNINLPDITTDKLGSEGLVSFRITVPSNTVLGTQIKNKAHIFFDYNSAIITNETMHTIDNTVYSDLSRGSMVQVGQVISGVNKGYNKSSVKIYPNPSSGIITVELPASGNNSEIRIISLTGVIQKSVMLSNSAVQQVNLEGIPQGMYLYEIREEGERKAGGLLQVK